MQTEPSAVRSHLADIDPEIMLLTPEFDDAIIGHGQRCGQPNIAIYSTTKVIALLMLQGLNEEDAFEHFAFNIEGAWMGPSTPIFMNDLEQEDTP